MGSDPLTTGPEEGRKLICARPESVATAGLFREAFAKRRCLVPAVIYYE